MKSLTAPEWYDESGNLVKPSKIRTVKIYARNREGETHSVFVTIITYSSAAINNRGTFIQCLGNGKGKIIAVSGYRDDGNTPYLYCGYSNDFGSGTEESIIRSSGLYCQNLGGRTLITFHDLPDETYKYEENGPIM